MGIVSLELLLAITLVVVVPILFVLLSFYYKERKIRRAISRLTETLDVRFDDTLRSPRLREWLNPFSDPGLKVDGDFLKKKVQFQLSRIGPAELYVAHRLEISLVFISRCPTFEVTKMRMIFGSAVGEKMELGIRSLDSRFCFYCERSRSKEFIDWFQDPLVPPAIESLLLSSRAYTSRAYNLVCSRMASSGNVTRILPSITGRTLQIAYHPYESDNLSAHNVRNVLENIHVLATALEARFAL